MTGFSSVLLERQRALAELEREVAACRRAQHILSVRTGRVMGAARRAKEANVKVTQIVAVTGIPRSTLYAHGINDKDSAA